MVTQSDDPSKYVKNFPNLEYTNEKVILEKYTESKHPEKYENLYIVGMDPRFPSPRADARCYRTVADIYVCASKKGFDHEICKEYEMLAKALCLGKYERWKEKIEEGKLFRV